MREGNMHKVGITLVLMFFSVCFFVSPSEGAVTTVLENFINGTQNGSTGGIVTDYAGAQAMYGQWDLSSWNSSQLNGHFGLLDSSNSSLVILNTLPIYSSSCLVSFSLDYAAAWSTTSQEETSGYAVANLFWGENLVSYEEIWWGYETPNGVQTGSIFFNNINNNGISGTQQFYLAIQLFSMNDLHSVFAVDNIAVTRTHAPVPPAAILLCSGLAGIGIIRRQFTLRKG